MFDLLDSFDEPEKVTGSSYTHAPTKYCGNKYDSLNYILPHMPILDTFVDVFGGSGQVLFGRKRSKLEVYNDRHSGMAAFYRCLQNESQMKAMIDRIGLLQHSRELFYAFKDEMNNPDLDVVDRAVKWYYMVQCSFAAKGATYGRTTKPDIPIYNKLVTYLDVFPYFHERLKGVNIENLGWEKCIKDYDSNSTVFYLDPPYIDSNQYDHKMTRGDHRRLCDTIFNSEGFFALSGYDNDLYDKYPWDDIHLFDIQQNFTAADQTKGAKSRSDTRREFLWIKEVT